MNRLLVIQHHQHHGMGRLPHLASARGLEIEHVHVDLGEAIPAQVPPGTGLVLLDAERSALDPAPWIRAERQLVELAMAHGNPCLGLGYGAQLMAQVSGASVRRIASPSYGWTPSWLGADLLTQCPGMPRSLEVFNAHEHEMGLPSNGHCVLFDKQCLNKGFALGPHLALMAPLLLTESDLRHWCEQPKTRLALARGPHVQARVSMLRALTDRFAAQGALADQLLNLWMAQRRGGDLHPDLPQAA